MALATWLGVRPAQAGSFELSWSAPAECPSASLIEAEVARVVGRPWSELSAGWRSARASVTPRERAYRVQVTVVTHSGSERERSVVAASCTEAAEAAVAILTAGMALDEPSSPLERGANGADGVSSAAETAAAGGNSAAPPVDPAATRDATHASDTLNATDASDATPVLPLLAASVGVDIGTLAAVAPFAQIAGGLEWGRLSALASATATGSVIGELDGTSAGAQMSLLTGSLAACLRLAATNPSVGGCAGVELGSLAARGIGTVESRQGRAFWSASLVRASLDWHVGATSAVSIGATGVVPFRRLHVIASPDEVHRTPSVALRPWIGLGLRFE
jgi:hypothetical protein